MNYQCDNLPQAMIYPDRITLFTERHWTPFKPTFKSDQIEPEKEPENENLLATEDERKDWKIATNKNPKFDHLLNSARSAQGNVSKTAKRKITNAINYLLLTTNSKKVYSRISGRYFSMKIAFVTLTLPAKQKHSDNEIKAKLLNQFLIEMKKRWKVDKYVWRAEKQHNGNLHFHILVNKFIPALEMRDVWNRICNKLGYVDDYRQNMKKFHEGGFKVREDLLQYWPKRDQKNAYEKGIKSNWANPNTTDIHSTRKLGNVRNYLIKYLSKNEIIDPETGEIFEKALEQKGRIWGCSQNLSNLKGARVDVYEKMRDEIKSLIHSEKYHTFVDDHFIVLYIDVKNLFKEKCVELLEAFSSFLIEKLNYNLQTCLN